jgi:hypothetical protein
MLTDFYPGNSPESDRYVSVLRHFVCISYAVDTGDR